MSARPVAQEGFTDGPLSVGWHRYGEQVLAVTLTGELDQSNVGSARRAIDDLTAAGGDAILVLDLSALEFIDSSGIELLVSLADLGDDGGRVRIVPSEAPGVSRMLELTGVASLIQIAREPPARAA